jgi:hypothetical protein
MNATGWKAKNNFLLISTKINHQQVNDSLAMTHSYCLKTGWHILVVSEMVTKNRRHYRKNNKFWKCYQLGRDILRK